MGTERWSTVRRDVRSSRCESCANARYRGLLPTLAPGTVLREGVELTRRRNTGALIVLGYGAAVEGICSGGFVLDTELTAAALAELAKMDGAIVVDSGRILRAATHLIPDRGIPTCETGTRHRTAERVARQTGRPVISVSSSSNAVTLYLDEQGHRVEDALTLTARAHQALSTLERCLRRLERCAAAPLGLDLGDCPTGGAAATRLLEVAHRCHEAIEDYAAALGAEGRALLLEREELAHDVDEDLRRLLRALCAAEEDEVARALRATRASAAPVARGAVPPPVSGEAVEDSTVW